LTTLPLELALNSAGIDSKSLAVVTWLESSPACFSLQGEGSNAMSLWGRLRSLTEYTGFWPVIAGDDERLNLLRDNYELELKSWEEKVSVFGEPASRHAEHSASSLRLNASGETLALEHWFDAKISEQPESTICEEGQWPVDLPGRQPQVLSLTKKYDYLVGAERPLKRIYTLLLPLTIPWHVPAFLHLGGFSACPQTDVHVAIAKRWNQRYGAEIISASNDTIEMQVNSPPKTKDEALRLAREQSIYCTSIVRHKFGTIASLAASLIDASLWSFWWD